MMSVMIVERARLTVGSSGQQGRVAKLMANPIRTSAGYIMEEIWRLSLMHKI